MIKHFYNKRFYSITAIAAFTTMIMILQFFNYPGFIRYHFGDAIVVVFIYSLLMHLPKVTYTQIIAVTIIISYTIEFLQSINFYTLFNSGSEVSQVVFGTNFDIIDIFCYTTSALAIYLCESLIRKNLKNENL